MTDDQLIESLRARMWPGDCEAAAFRLEELRARVAELEALPGNVMAQRVETPSSHWSADGKPDPHGKTYDCERAGLHMGNLTDDELANGAFLNYDQPLNVAGILAGTYHSPIAWMTAVKDRIRWLSRSLEKAVAERDALAAELKALREQEPVAQLLDRISDAMQSYDRHGAICIFEGSPMIYASTLTEIADIAAIAESAIESSSKPCAFRLGDLVKKVSGSAWEGRIVGTYSTALTPEGYAVESASHPGSVQIYPAKALTLVIQEAGIQPTEGQHAQHVDVSGENVNATFRISKQTGADALVGLRGCNRRHGGMRSGYPCIYRMRTTDPGCTGCADRDEDQPAEAGG